MDDKDISDFTHKAEDYAALDGKDLPADMVQDILQRTQMGLPLTSEQCQALGFSSRLEHVILTPKDPKKMTQKQLYAMFGGEETAKRKIAWFQWEIIVINIEAMLKEGKTVYTNEDGSAVSLTDLLVTAKHQRDLASRRVDEQI